MRLCSTELPRSAAARVLGRSRSRGLRRVRCRRAGSARAIAALVAGSTLALAPAAQAETTSYRISQSEPFSLLVTSCTGEEVLVTGQHHFESHYTVSADPSGARFHSQEVHKYSLRGTGTVSGALYQNQHEEMNEKNGTFTLDPSGGFTPYEETLETTMVLIRQGETVLPDDLYFRLRYHVTYNVNGLVTMRGPTIDVICR